MKYKNQNLLVNVGKTARKSALALSVSVSVAGCTGAPGGFRLSALSEAFSSLNVADINTKVDMLWVVDNSASMDTHQKKLRNGFTAFAQKYLKPTWDMRLGVITTDTYLANSAFTNFYTSTAVSGTNGWQSAHIFANRASWSDAKAPGLVNTTTWNFTRNVRYNDLVPSWNSSYAQLLANVHDGPIPALCFEGYPYFFYGHSNCAVRDFSVNTGTANCLNPAGGEDSTTQCVNTVQNNSIHSGRPIISTKPPTGTPGDAAWVQQLADDFMINASVGASGSGSERGLQSVSQFLTDNETNVTAFFRPGSIRVIIFISDEEDQSQELPVVVPGNYNPFSNYAGGCAPKTVNGYTYTLSTCVNPATLTTVASHKTQLDNFFQTLDGSPTAPTNYFIASIVATTGASIQALQALHDPEDVYVTGFSNVAVDQGARYMELGTAVGNGSLSMDIDNNDYTPVLNAIGNSIVQKAGTFTLSRAPTAAEETIVKILHADGSSTSVASSKYTVVGPKVTITDVDTILAMAATDRVSIYYQPSTQF